MVLVRLPQPVRHRRLDFIAVGDADEIRELGPGALHHLAHLRRLDRASQHDPDLEVFRLRAHEEVADLLREHDRVVRRVDALLAELDRRLAQAFPRVLQVLGQFRRERRFGRRPAVVRFAFLDPLLAVKTLVARHDDILGWPIRGPSRKPSKAERDWCRIPGARRPNATEVPPGRPSRSSRASRSARLSCARPGGAGVEDLLEPPARRREAVRQVPDEKAVASGGVRH